MKVYTYSEARQRLAALLGEASREGEVRIRRRDGRVFALQPVQPPTSPLDVPGVSANITTDEVVALIREGRRSRYRAGPSSKQLRPTRTRRASRSPRH
jgi:hypothetical protein